MHAQLSFWEEPRQDDTPLVWSTLDDEQRARVIAALARLIAMAASKRFEAAAARGEENRDD